MEKCITYGSITVNRKKLNGLVIGQLWYFSFGSQSYFYFFKEFSFAEISKISRIFVCRLSNNDFCLYCLQSTSKHSEFSISVWSATWNTAIEIFCLSWRKYRCRKINREQFCAWLFLHYQPGLIWTKAPSFFMQKGIRSCTTKTHVISKNTLADFHAAVNFLTGIF